ncbi:N-acetylmuramic acid 6-phosphate etherase [Paractinoplanes rhizophilus]|uniref:N-acetylmuramic acid 6-phosphate etherase n=1 Tax=Paractinoplanes rhizophilus TaxID=1416877 RepID=A0ABW2HKS3_9ACTN|nr:N-acetylmuramic acid 6-phosphate etherase [Actinoplanes sp.]
MPPIDPPAASPWVVAPTEERNPDTVGIDLAGTLDVLRMINDEDAKVAGAVRAVLPALAEAVDLATEALRAGHRVHYFGAGTSGRIALMDAAELIPTYGTDPSQVVAHHAGGTEAVGRPIENLEDDEASGAADAAGLRPGDVAVGLTASGRTPYVIGALRAARARDARTILISANPAASFGAEVDVHAGVATGPEVVAGSTRMKAGTAQKMLLNAFSTALMIRTGRTFSNLMVAVGARNAKLRGRVVRILVEATGLDPRVCAEAAERAGGDGRVALVSLLAEIPVDAARRALAESGGAVRQALALAGRRS